jgi:hypothetical protein
MRMPSGLRRSGGLYAAMGSSEQDRAAAVVGRKRDRHRAVAIDDFGLHLEAIEHPVAIAVELAGPGQAVGGGRDDGIVDEVS